MTYNELVLELQTLPYSKEFMEIKKESYELELMESYIENQLYLRENFNNFDVIQNDIILEGISDKIKTIASNIWTKIYNFFIGILKMIHKALGSLINFIERHFNPTLEGRAKAEAEKVAKDLLDAGKNIGKDLMNKVKNKIDDGLTVEATDPFTKYNLNMNDENKRRFREVNLHESLHPRDFIKNYKKIINKFNNLKVFLDKKYIIASYVQKGDIDKFLKNDDTENIEKICKIFIDLLKNDFNKRTIIFYIDPHNITLDNPILSIENYIDLFKPFTDNFIIPDKIMKYFCFKFKDNKIKGKLKNDNYYSYIASMLLMNLISMRIGYKLEDANRKKWYANKKYIELKMDYKKYGTDLYYSIDKLMGNANKSIDDITKHMKTIYSSNIKLDDNKSIKMDIAKLLKIPKEYIKSQKIFTDFNGISTNVDSVNINLKRLSILNNNLLSLFNYGLEIEDLIESFIWNT